MEETKQFFNIPLAYIYIKNEFNKASQNDVSL